MKKKLFLTLVIFSAALFPAEVEGQKNESVAGFISERFNSYCKAVPREEIFIHTDREEYIAGEGMWFSAYLIDRKSNGFTSGNSIVYFELLNPRNNIIVQKKFLVSGGKGAGYAALPDSLYSGTYTIRAYTSRMKNFMPSNCFSKVISIYNSQTPGNFKTFIAPEDNDTTPGRIIMNSGFRLHIDRPGDKKLKLSVDASSASSYYSNDSVCIFIQSHGNICFVKTICLKDGSGRIIIPESGLLPGVNQISLFDSFGEQVYEKNIYVRDSMPGEMISADLPAASVPGENITINLVSDKPLSFPEKSGMSISISPYTKRRYQDIRDFLVFGTEYGSLPARMLKDRKISDLTAEEMDTLVAGLKSSWIDWEFILSGKRPAFRYLPENDETFFSGTLLKTDTMPAPADEFLVMSSPGKNAIFQYAVTDSLGDFAFAIPFSLHGRRLIIQNDNNTVKYRIKTRSTFYNSGSTEAGIVDSSGHQIPSYIPRWFSNYQISSSYDLSYRGDFIKWDTLSHPHKRFYGKPDFELKMADYVKLPDMEEVFFELLPRVSLKRGNSGCEISISDATGKKIFDTPPVLMIDGVFIRDAELICNLDPGLVEKIDVIWGRYVVDEYLFPGLINIITKSGDLSAIQLPADALVFEYETAEPVPVFLQPYFPVQDKKKSRIPDFRNTLYWNPGLVPGHDGKIRLEFRASNFTTDYLISIQGLTGEGRAISYNSVFRIEKKVPAQK